MKLVEQRLTRRFAGRINAERQRALGISSYIWRSRDDGKVRASHAVHDDKVFRWDSPPADGHPGEAHNCRCIAEPIDQVERGERAPFDGFELRFGQVDRGAVLRNAALELRILGDALRRLATSQAPDDIAARQQLAAAYLDAAYRYALAAPNANDLENSGLIFLQGADRARLLAGAKAFRQGANDLARAMSASDFFTGTTARAVVAELRQRAPGSANRYFNAIILLASARHIPQSLANGPERAAALNRMGGGLVAAARAVENERWGGRPFFSNAGQLTQWDALHAEMQRLASQGARAEDGAAATAGMRQETGRRFYPGALEAISGGALGVIMRGARGPLRITRGMLGPDGKLLGENNAGRHAPRFDTWLRRPDNSIDILPDGKVRYATKINDPESAFDGKTVSVEYSAEGVPDFSPYSVARADVRNPVGRTRGGKPSDADMRAATRILREEIRAGRISRDLFTPRQAADITRGAARIDGLAWHHDGLSRNPNGSGSMRLVDRVIHKRFSHQGWASTETGDH